MRESCKIARMEERRKNGLPFKVQVTFLAFLGLSSTTGILSLFGSPFSRLPDGALEYSTTTLVICLQLKDG